MYVFLVLVLPIVAYALIGVSVWVAAYRRSDAFRDTANSLSDSFGPLAPLMFLVQAALWPLIVLFAVGWFMEWFADKPFREARARFTEQHAKPSVVPGIASLINSMRTTPPAKKDATVEPFTSSGP